MVGLAEKKFLILVFFISFFIRAGVFVALLSKNDNAWIYPDSVQYHTAALQLVVGKGFINPDGTSQVYRLPGYPLFLAACYILFGSDSNKTLWVQIVLASFIPLLIFLLARILFPEHMAIAKFAAVIAALHVGLIIYAGMMATETLFLIALLIFFILLFSRKYFFLTGLILGCASLIRPVGVYLLIISLLYIAFTKVHRGSISLFIGWGCLVAPWLLRNMLMTGYIFFHTLPGLHFLQYSAAYVLMEKNNCSYAQVRPMLLQEWKEAVEKQEQKIGKKLNEYQRCVIAESIAFTYMKQNPWYTIKTSLIQIIKTCCSLYTAQTLLSDSGIWPDYTRDTTLWTKMKRFLIPQVKHRMLILLIYWEIINFAMMILGVLCFLIACYIKRSWRSIFFTAAPYMFMFVFITLAYGCARLRFSIEPFIIIFSGAGWVWVYSLMRGKRNIF